MTVISQRDQALWQEWSPVWPVIIVEEAQNLNAAALEELRLLTCARPDTQIPFSLVLVGDEDLLGRLELGVNRALVSRLGFCLQLKPWSIEILKGNVHQRLQEVGVHVSPLEAAAAELLVQSAQGQPAPGPSSLATGPGASGDGSATTGHRHRCAKGPGSVALAQPLGASGILMEAAMKLDRHQIQQAHDAYCELTGQALSLGFDRERLWFELLKTGITLEDLRRVITYLQREIREGRRNVGALKLSNLLQPDRFKEDLQISRVRLHKNFPATNARPTPVRPQASSPQGDPRARERGLEILRQFRQSLR